MMSALGSTQDETGMFGEHASWALKRMSRSVSLMTVIGGVVMIVTSPLMAILNEIMAVVWVIWGVAATVAGTVAYIALWLNKTVRE